MYRLFITIVMGVVACGAAMAADLWTPVETLFASASNANEHGNWLSGINGAKFAQVQDAENLWVAALSGGTQGKIAFNGHTPLDLTALPPDSAISCRIKIKSNPSGQPVKFTFCWQLASKNRSTAVSATLNATADWQTIQLPLPAATEKATGYWLTFSAKGDYEITDIAVVKKSAVTVAPVQENALLDKRRLELSGQAQAGIDRLTVLLDGRPVLADQPVTGGRYQITVPAAALPECRSCKLTIQGRSGDRLFSVETDAFFTYPEIKNTRLPPVTVRNGQLTAGGKPFGFVGTNYTDFDLGLSCRSDMDRKTIAKAVKTMSEWGMTVVRVPVNLGLIQSSEGVFPDQPQWKKDLLQHNLNPEFFAYLEYFIQVAADHGIYTILELHGIPANPYRYFLGGTPSDESKGKPGTAIAWMGEGPTKVRHFPNFSKSNDVAAICRTFAWMAGHFKGNPNLLGFEVPYNEPNCAFMSVPANYRKVTVQTVRAVTDRDPERLTFAMPASWGHDNSLSSSTWLPPEGVTGTTPHYYIGNGPVKLRPDAQKSKQPWLCRDIDATFDYSMAAVMLPHSQQNYPVYNGEGGEHGCESLLPNMPPNQAADYMVDATLAQVYAAGLAGMLQWTLWNEKPCFEPYKDAYAKHYPRFSKVFAAGPRPWQQAEVAFIQNPAAEPISNGHNYSCVPIARMMLDLHLDPVHYLTDDEIVDRGLAQTSEGLEQVSAAQFSCNYKALVVDKRNLDARVLRVLRGSKVPVLWVDDMNKLDKKQLASFLQQAGVKVNLKSPAEIQLIAGPEHLVLYRRSGNDGAPVKVYPMLSRKGQFELIDEQGKSVFNGTAEELYQNGISVKIPKWHSLILTCRNN